VTDTYFPESDDPATERVYAISLTNTAVTNTTTTKMRILKEQEDGDVTTYLRVEDRWKEIPYTEIGSYLEVSFTGTDAVIRVSTTPTIRAAYVVVAVVVILAAAGLIFLGLNLLIKRKTEKKEIKQ
jgi:hypothetical protein